MTSPVYFYESVAIDIRERYGTEKSDVINYKQSFPKGQTTDDDNYRKLRSALRTGRTNRKITAGLFYR
ncbi:hypothetical protein DSCW_37080 [Desulfosarcina widdelii]|uniref:Uncharacterized protein n=1 Tax=Desulfosarcina widdelii TaxID=947919 RepID=A0A5K7Z9A4_9BACT|nr:hypothetical protein DSCW_37080 [Desulfosarcina widdelii]